MFIECIEIKKKIISEVSTYLDEDSIKRALADYHSRRRPRFCGLTIHTGVGCPFECRYCYIYSMGFPNRIERYPLQPLELLYSILCNPYFLPSRYGTLLALGSVTEPLHKTVFEYTLELLSLFRKYLGNPVQLSTKMVLDLSSAKLLYLSNPSISYLLTIVSLRDSRILEPNAPDAYLRISSLKALNRVGVHTTLFIRPILPGYTDRDVDDILRYSLDEGTNRVVFGTLRVNKMIIDRLIASGVDVDAIRRRVRGPMRLKRQVSINGSDLKHVLSEKALSLGFKVFPSACSANIDASGQACGICGYGPCGDPHYMPVVDEDDVLEFLDAMGFSGMDVSVGGWSVSLRIPKRIGRRWLGRSRYIVNIISTLSRRRVFIKNSVSTMRG